MEKIESILSKSTWNLDKDDVISLIEALSSEMNTGELGEIQEQRMLRIRQKIRALDLFERETMYLMPSGSPSLILHSPEFLQSHYNVLVNDIIDEGRDSK